MKTLSSLHVYIFIVIFEVHCTNSRYGVYLEEYMDLSLRLISSTKSEHTEPMRRAKRSVSKKYLKK